MKKYLFLLFVSTYGVSTVAMQKITLPSQQEIYRRLCEIKLEDFVSRSTIHERMGSQSINPCAFFISVKILVNDFNTFPESPDKNTEKLKMEQTIIETLLHDQPKAIEILQKIKF